MKKLLQEGTQTQFTVFICTIAGNLMQVLLLQAKIVQGGSCREREIATELARALPTAFSFRLQRLPGPSCVYYKKMADIKLPQWMEKADVGTVAALTLDDGECLTAEVRDFNDERDELIVDVVSSSRVHPNNSQRSRAIPICRVVSFEPRPRAEQPWPYSDPCRSTSFSFARFVLMATLFLCLTVGSLPLFFLLMKRPYGFQVASAIVYTIFAVFFTFARTGTRTGKDLLPYMFTCPAVRTQVSRLLWRHLGFVVALFALQTLALGVRPSLPDWWNTGSEETPFELGLMLVCVGLGFAQVFTNRRVLGRAHREFSP